MNKYILSDVEYVEPVINYLCWNLLKYTNNNNIIKISLLHEFEFMFRNIIYDTQTKSYYYITYILTKHNIRAYNCIEVLTNANKFHFFVLFISPDIIAAFDHRSQYFSLSCFAWMCLSGICAEQLISYKQQNIFNKRI